MSDAERVQTFNPFMVLIWVLQLIILGIDYSADQRVTWSIPIIGSFLVIQIYMIWKTNYDEMMEDHRAQEAKTLGGSLIEDTPVIQPGVTDLASANKGKQSHMINLSFAPSVKETEKSDSDE